LSMDINFILNDYRFSMQEELMHDNPDLTPKFQQVVSSYARMLGMSEDELVNLFKEQYGDWADNELYFTKFIEFLKYMNGETEELPEVSESNHYERFWKFIVSEEATKFSNYKVERDFLRKEYAKITREAINFIVDAQAQIEVRLQTDILITRDFISNYVDRQKRMTKEGRIVFAKSLFFLMISLMCKLPTFSHILGMHTLTAEKKHKGHGEGKDTIDGVFFLVYYLWDSNLPQLKFIDPNHLRVRG
jgi:hypothetical protein